MRLVIALGGNALLRRGEAMSLATQAANVSRAMDAIAPLILEGHQIAITHGNGPQIGWLAVAQNGTEEWPLDVLGAESQAMIGYQLERALQSRLPRDRLVATLLTQVIVDPADPSLKNPSKPVGACYSREVADKLAVERRWIMGADQHSWRRLVPSPRPRRIVEARVIEFLIHRGVIVICAGGGGVPVVELDSGELVGIEAVIDKDFTSACLATLLNADHLLLLTDVDAVYLGYGTPELRAVARAGLTHLDPADFAPGSIRPKIDAALEFASRSGRPASIGRLQDAVAILNGQAGTRIASSEEVLSLRN